MLSDIILSETIVKRLLSLWAERESSMGGALLSAQPRLLFFVLVSPCHTNLPPFVTGHTKTHSEAHHTDIPTIPPERGHGAILYLQLTSRWNV